MSRTTILLAAALFGATGCAARLTVSVDVYDGERPLPYAYQIAFADQVLDRPTMLKDDVEVAAGNAVDEASTKFAAIAKTDRKSLVKMAIDKIPQQSVYDLARDFLSICNVKKPRRRKDFEKHEKDCAKRFAELRLAVAKEEAALLSASAALKKELIKKVSKPEVEQVELIVDAHFRPWKSRGIAAGSAVDGRAVGTPLFDPMVGTLARGSSPLRREIRTMRVDGRRAWIPFSRANFRANGGNSQFVVVREGHLVFRQKSLDFDPTPVVGAGVATAKLGLKVASALMSAYGVALPGAQGEGAGAGDSGSEDESTALKDELARRRAQTRAFVGRLANLYERLEQPGLDEAKRVAIRNELEREIALFEALSASDGADP
ncbi:MAG: hypothetical protein R3B09_23820 [Nannocystaceae bacterium]